MKNIIEKASYFFRAVTLLTVETELDGSQLWTPAGLDMYSTISNHR